MAKVSNASKLAAINAAGIITFLVIVYVMYGGWTYWQVGYLLGFVGIYACIICTNRIYAIYTVVGAVSMVIMMSAISYLNTMPALIVVVFTLYAAPRAGKVLENLSTKRITSRNKNQKVNVDSIKALSPQQTEAPELVQVKSTQSSTKRIKKKKFSLSRKEREAAVKQALLEKRS